MGAGIVFAGELFPADGEGISEGANLSPYPHIYGDRPIDYANGNMVRFADDIVIFTRTKKGAEHIIDLLSGFLADRGLTLSKAKTSINLVEDGFNFLAQTFIKKGGYIYSYPSETTIQRFISEIKSTMRTYDVLKVLGEIEATPPKGARCKKEYPRRLEAYQIQTVLGRLYNSFCHLVI